MGRKKLPKWLNTDPRYCSYIPMLVKAMMRVTGDVLELGAGIHSTYFLHWLCKDQGRQLYTYENDKGHYNLVKECEADFHHIYLVDDWDAIDIERPWGVVLIDHSPASRRRKDVKRLAFYAKCIVLHDSQGRSDRHYRYSEIWPLFRYRRGYGKAIPQTTVVSNFIDVIKWP